VLRTKPVSLLAAFDAPVMTVNCDRRFPSTTAPQALLLMNSEFVLKEAGAAARRVRAETPRPAALPEQVGRLWQLVYQRPITSEELSQASAFVALQRQVLARLGASGDKELTVLTNLCQQLLNSNEFLYVD
jgi:hypothetical protein